MAFNIGEESDSQEMSEINMIPLIDVMLVLLILFIITAPLFTPHAFQIDVPEAETEQTEELPDIIALALDQDGKLFWGDELIDDAQLRTRLQVEAQKKPQPPIHLRADQKTTYQQLADIMEAVQQSGMKQLGFITQP